MGRKCPYCSGYHEACDDNEIKLGLEENVKLKTALAEANQRVETEIARLKAELADKDMELYKLKYIDDELHRDNVLLKAALVESRENMQKVSSEISDDTTGNYELALRMIGVSIAKITAVLEDR